MDKTWRRFYSMRPILEPEVGYSKNLRCSQCGPTSLTRRQRIFQCDLNLVNYMLGKVDRDSFGSTVEAALNNHTIANSLTCMIESLWRDTLPRYPFTVDDVTLKSLQFLRCLLLAFGGVEIWVEFKQTVSDGLIKHIRELLYPTSPTSCSAQYLDDLCLSIIHIQEIVNHLVSLSKNGSPWEQKGVFGFVPGFNVYVLDRKPTTITALKEIVENAFSGLGHIYEMSGYKPFSDEDEGGETEIFIHTSTPKFVGQKPQKLCTEKPRAQYNPTDCDKPSGSHRRNSGPGFPSQCGESSTQKPREIVGQILSSPLVSDLFKTTESLGLISENFISELSARLNGDTSMIEAVIVQGDDLIFCLSRAFFHEACKAVTCRVLWLRDEDDTTDVVCFIRVMKAKLECEAAKAVDGYIDSETKSNAEDKFQCCDCDFNTGPTVDSEIRKDDQNPKCNTSNASLSGGRKLISLLTQKGSGAEELLSWLEGPEADPESIDCAVVLSICNIIYIGRRQTIDGLGLDYELLWVRPVNGETDLADLIKSLMRERKAAKSRVSANLSELATVATTKAESKEPVSSKTSPNEAPVHAEGSIIQKATDTKQAVLQLAAFLESLPSSGEIPTPPIPSKSAVTDSITTTDAFSAESEALKVDIPDEEFSVLSLSSGSNTVSPVSTESDMTDYRN